MRAGTTDISPIKKKEPTSQKVALSSMSEDTNMNPASSVQGCDYTLKYTDWQPIAFAVCQAESKGQTDAVGDTRPIRGILAPSCGLMQIRTLRGRPSCEQLHNPEFNVDYAHEMWKGQGFKPWSTYKNGEYLKWL
jgi:hypothetical protein